MFKYIFINVFMFYPLPNGTSFAKLGIKSMDVIVTRYLFISIVEHSKSRGGSVRAMVSKAEGRAFKSVLTSLSFSEFVCEGVK